MKDIERFARVCDIISAQTFEDGYRQGWLSTIEILNIIALRDGEAPREFLTIYPEQTKALIRFYKVLKEMMTN